MSAAAHLRPLRPLARYLERFAEPLAALGERGTDRKADSRAPAADVINAQRIDACRSGSYRWVLVVPAFDEAANFVQQLVRNLQFTNQTKALLVIQVINVPEDASAEQRKRTLATLPPSSEISPADLGDGIHVLTIDAASQPLPADQATGLARKLGNDIACRLAFDGHLKNSVLCNSDADAQLPSDYFRRLAGALSISAGENTGDNAADSSAWIFPFQHRGATPELDAAGASYELYLRSLHMNLAESGSPYAYPALGSVLAVDTVQYAKSRGFPKRRAGEDFYLLNKLAKLGQISYLSGAPVLLAARTSSRVPFGTGPAIAAALKTTAHSGQPIGVTTYSLTSFALLKQFFLGFRELAPVDRANPRSPQSRQNAQPNRQNLPIAWRDPDLAWLLKRLGVPAALAQISRNHTTRRGLQRGLHEWFDGLKTVRFLNEARHFAADESLTQQFEHLAKIGGLPVDTPLPSSASALNCELERVRPASRHSVALTLAQPG